MKLGLLWYGDYAAGLARCREKYGEPVRVLVPLDYEGDEGECDSKVLPDYIWFILEDDDARNAGS